MASWMASDDQFRLRCFSISMEEAAKCFDGHLAIDRAKLAEDARIHKIVPSDDGRALVVVVRSVDFEVIPEGEVLPNLMPPLPLRGTTWRDRGPML